MILSAGATSSPGHPGITPIAPKWLRSKNEASDTMASTVPCTHSTGGFCARSTMPEVSKWPGAMVLSTPRRPGAKPGQFGLATLSPG